MGLWRIWLYLIALKDLQHICGVQFLWGTVLLTPCCVVLTPCKVVSSTGPFWLVNGREPFHCWKTPEISAGLVQGWLPLSLYIKPICLWLDFTFEEHNHKISGDCSLQLPRGFGHWQKSSNREGCSDWFREVIHCRTLRIACFGCMRIIFQLHISFLKHFYCIYSPTKSKVWRQKEMLHFVFSTLSCTQSVSVVLVQLPRKQL